MKTFFQQNKTQGEYQEFNKENQGRSKANVIMSRHGRVQSTVALNIRRDKSLTSTSFQNISSNIISDPIRHLRPQFRLQRCSKGDNESFDALHIPTQRTKFCDERNQSFNTRIGMVVERVRTDTSIPSRNIINLKHPSILHNLSHNLSSVQSTTNNDSRNFVHFNQIITHNPQDVHVYFDEIFNHTIHSNLSSKLSFTAFTFQSEVTEKMRSVLLDWIVDVHFKFKLKQDSLYLTIHLIDMYVKLLCGRILEKIQIPKNKFQLYGISALFIASKYEEVYSVPHVRDLIYVCDNAYTKQDILSTEGQILIAINFNIVHDSTQRLLALYQEYLKYDLKNYLLANYIVELAILEYSTIKYPVNVVVCAALYLVNKIRRCAPSWPDLNLTKSTLSEIDIRPCAKELCSLLQNCDKKAFTSVKKKFSLPKYLEVARIRIEKKSQ